jgi:hypothetical protein
MLVAPYSLGGNSRAQFSLWQIKTALHWRNDLQWDASR